MHSSWPRHPNYLILGTLLANVIIRSSSDLHRQVTNIRLFALVLNNAKPARWPTFGIKLSARPTAPVIHRFDVKGTFGLARAMVGTMSNFHDQIHIDDPSVLARTMFVDTTGVHATDFDLDARTAQRLYDNGRTAAETFLASWNWEEYLAKYWAPRHPSS